MATNQQIFGNNQQTKTEDHPLRRARMHQRRKFQQHQMITITVVISIRMATRKLDATRRKGK
jgi:hypothetical protein